MGTRFVLPTKLRFFFLLLTLPFQIAWSKVKKTLAGTQLYLVFQKIVEERKKTGKREDDPMQLLIDEGDTTVQILQVSVISTRSEVELCIAKFLVVSQFIVGALFAGLINSSVPLSQENTKSVLNISLAPPKQTAESTPPTCSATSPSPLHISRKRAKKYPTSPPSTPRPPPSPSSTNSSPSLSQPGRTLSPSSKSASRNVFAFTHKEQASGGTSIRGKRSSKRRGRRCRATRS